MTCRGSPFNTACRRHLIKEAPASLNPFMLRDIPGDNCCLALGLSMALTLENYLRYLEYFMKIALVRDIIFSK